MNPPKTWFDPTESSFAEFVRALESTGGEDPRLRSLLRHDFHNVRLARTPKVSIIISTYNQVDLLKRNLDVIRSMTTYKNYEIIIATNDLDRNPRMREFLDTVDCRVYVHEGRFSYAALNNSAATKATGEFLLFLNDDVEILAPRWIEHLLRLGLDESVGAVGGKVVFYDGRLQNGGTIIWKNNADLTEYGMFQNPANPEFNYVHEVDQVSTCILVRSDVFHKLGGFNTSYLRTRSEDIDFCIGIREKLKLRILYQPLAVIHCHGEYTARSSDIYTHLCEIINHKAIYSKWKKQLELHMVWVPENMHIAINRRSSIRILYVDSSVPAPDKHHETADTFNILMMLASIGCTITFWPEHQIRTEPYTTELQQKGIEVIYNHGNLGRFLDRRKGCFDIVILARFCYVFQFIDGIKETNPNCKVIYNATDLNLLESESIRRHILRWRGRESSRNPLVKKPDLVWVIEHATALNGQHPTNIPVIINMQKAALSDILESGFCDRILGDVQSPETMRFSLLRSISGMVRDLNLYARYRRLISNTHQSFVNLNLMSHMKNRPKFSILIDAHNASTSQLKKSIESIILQEYDNLELFVVNIPVADDVHGMIKDYCSLDSRITAESYARTENTVELINAALYKSSGDYVIFLDHNGDLTSDALFQIVKTINTNSCDPHVIYTDDKTIDTHGKTVDIRHKPRWSPELLLSYNYTRGLVAYKKGLIEKIGGMRARCAPAHDYDLLLRAVESDHVSIRHIARVSYNKYPVGEDVERQYICAGKIALSDALQRRKIHGMVRILNDSEGMGKSYKIDFKMTSFPSVHVIIQHARSDENTLEDYMGQKITYPNCQITHMGKSNKIKSPSFYSHKKPKQRIEDSKADDQNVSNPIDHMLQTTKSKYVLLAKAGIDAISTHAIEEMVGYLESDSKIAIVGTKPYITSQSSYTVIAPDQDDHVYGCDDKSIPCRFGMLPDDAGHTQNCSAVSADMMVIRKTAYADASMRNDHDFQSYHDADLCLRVHECGYRIVYDPHVLACNNTSYNPVCSTVIDPKETARFRKKWGYRIKNDPYHNPNTVVENARHGGDEKPMKILFTTSSLNFAGASTSTCMLADGFRKRGHRTAVMSPVDGPLREWCMNRDVDTVINSAYFYDPVDISGFLREFDLICVNSVDSSTLVQKTQDADVPVVWIVRESDRRHHEELGRDLSLFPCMDKIMFVSDSTRMVYEDLNTSNNFLTIPNGVDLDNINSFKELNTKEDMRERYGLDDKKKIITIVGNICERKGQLDFARAAANLLKNKSDLLFLIVGRSMYNESDYVEKIEHIIQDGAHMADIRIVPNTSDVWDYYVMSDVFVCASNNESFPRVVLEAMAFELPIVATRVFGIPEQISDRMEGILVEPNDSRQIECGILHMLENPDDAASMAKKAYEKVIRNFVMDDIVQRHEDLYRQVIDHRWYSNAHKSLDKT